MAARQQWFETLRLSIAQEHGKGLVGHVKRNSSSMSTKTKPPRRVIPLDVPGLEGEGARLLALCLEMPRE